MKVSYLKGIVVTIVALLAVGLVGAFSVTSMRMASKKIALHTLPALSHLSLANQTRGQTFLRLLLYVSEKNPTQWQSYKREIESLTATSDSELRQYEKSITTDENRVLFIEYMESRNAYIEAREKIFQDVDANSVKSILEEMHRTVLPRYEEYLNTGNKLVEYTVNEGLESSRQINRVSLISQILVGLLSVGLFVLGFILGYSR